MLWRILLASLLFLQQTDCETDFPPLNVLTAQFSAQSQTEGVQDLLYRILPDHAWQFQITIQPSMAENRDYVRVENGVEESVIHVLSSSGVGVCRGVLEYLRGCCDVHVSWEGLSLSLPSLLPPLPQPITTYSVGQFRYMSNVCTFSYSYVWWGWAEWEKFIDWMALQGINLPLAHVGREAIWNDVWKDFGLSQKQIDQYFTGPAFLAWHRMGNLMGWGGGLTHHWLLQQKSLQKRIVRRMASLGMIPVLPAFSGFVPKALKLRYPEAKIERMNCWNPFKDTQQYSCLDFLHPTDPLFNTIGTAYMRKMTKEFGGYHAYSADSFNEMTPTSFNHSYLASVSRAIYGAISTADPNAIWVMQAWLFLDPDWLPGPTEAFLTAIPKGKVLLLDLFSESEPQYQKFNSYFGQPFVWSMLHDFGGNAELIGSQQQVNQGLTNALVYPNVSVVGTGLTMEGIYQNYVLYQFMLDRSWGWPPWDPVDSDKWVSTYAISRYGKLDARIQEAWRLLWNTIYKADVQNDVIRGHSHFTHSPYRSNIRGHKSYVNFLYNRRPKLGCSFSIWFEVKDVCHAWKILVGESDVYAKNNLFRQDLADITRQILEFINIQNYYKLEENFKQKDEVHLATNGQAFLTVFDELDELLSTHDHFLLGRWLHNARKKAVTESEADQYEWNFRNQLTLWGPDGQILDYARKQWAGMIKYYYKPRWSLFLNRLEESLKSGHKFNRTLFNMDVFRLVEKPFTLSKQTLPYSSVGDTVKTVKKLFSRYYNQCLQIGNHKVSNPNASNHLNL